MYICPRAKECSSPTCNHIVPHLRKEMCKIICKSSGAPAGGARYCIPYEDKTTLFKKTRKESKDEEG